ncbi:acetyltransferase (GNAT) domain-containing protein [Nocardia nova SH22a]|uniref:Acetyltransferase (GNAT) domain-containing protein n=1 Tax=Nocardia nova SH22a TaxID=1415166 RepID=W5TG18_9NOCA|nr:sterol carrier protein domain-containing protein [Nocardia nova]AHH18300.1 acetyltransferase (GNAT) domain-containing protein [Nocardia nova SH22a]
MATDITVTVASAKQWSEFVDLAKRSYGQDIKDAEQLREVADCRVAVRSGTVIAGGVGLTAEQFFGGQEVRSGLLAGGCIAPEERGSRLAGQLLLGRIGPLIDDGAVLVSAWTTSNEYGRKLGWQAPCPVYSWRVRADDLRRAFSGSAYQVNFGISAEGETLIGEVCRRWNGAIRRPPWWTEWKIRQMGLDVYEFRDDSGIVSGVTTVSGVSKEPVRELRVHDFIAGDAAVAATMFNFLSRYNSLAEWVGFRRASLPPAPLLLHNLSRVRAEAQAHHPWMLRILNVEGALQQRGWREMEEQEFTMALVDNFTGETSRYDIEVRKGAADVSKSTRDPDFTLDMCQLASWYAGGYRSAESARLDGISCHSSAPSRALDDFVALTNAHEVWLPEQF